MRSHSNAYYDIEEIKETRRNTPSTLLVETDQGGVYAEPFSLPKIESASALGRTMTQEVVRQSGSRNIPSGRASVNLLEQTYFTKDNFMQEIKKLP